MQLSVRKPNKITYLNSISTRRDKPFLPAFLIRCILLRAICHPNNINIVTSFRLGRKTNHKIRPLKVILSYKSHRTFLLDNTRFIPNKLPVKWQKVVIIRDLTPAQRQERKDRFEARRGQQVAAPPPRHPPSPVAMEIEAREPSPIRIFEETLSQVNVTPAPQGRDPFNETTQFESTIIGPLQ